ncbi:restriction endonuclease [Palleronia sp. LCG004]|uniref:restriction endonuclease n=1 Tax=Palleronia sp. LCG004 TaxID=3079304 RepID=UPI00294222F9|nr:restriction endonuclease [Palleronia sp. LCG004]WOI56728.1 restriction endonuclease [Palleronia sp. LCG004]
MPSDRLFIIEPEGLPDLAGMMVATLDALRHLGGSGSIQEIDETVIELEGLSEAEQAIPMPNNDQRLKVNYYLAWARTYLRRGGAVENSARGVWAITEAGSAIHDRAPAAAIVETVQAEEREKARQKRKAKEAAEVSGDADVVIADADAGPADEEDWKAALLTVLGSMAPDAFERLSQRLLREAGFTKVEVRGKTGDGGIDGLGVLRVNLVSFQVYFQCKRWRGSVGAKEIRDFRGALQGRADKGLFITTSHYTPAATDEATRDGAIAIDLIDGDRLCDLLKENGLGVGTEMVERVRIDGTWFDSV